MIVSDEGIVLRLSEYSETSQIASLFTARHGLVRLIAKGARRSTKTHFAVGLDLLERGAMQFVPPRGDAGLGTLTEWKQRDGFAGVRRGLAPLYAALYAIEVVHALVEEHDPHAALYEGLAELLTTLAGGHVGAANARLGEQANSARPLTSEQPAAARALAVFQACLLAEIGYAPSMHACVECGATRAPGRMPYISATQGGLLCRDCELHFVDKRAMPAGMADSTPQTGRAEDWVVLQNYLIRHIAGRELQTAKATIDAIRRTARA